MSLASVSNGDNLISKCTIFQLIENLKQALSKSVTLQDLF